MYIKKNLSVFFPCRYNEDIKDKIPSKREKRPFKAIHRNVARMV